MTLERWWQGIDARLWRWAGMPDDLVRERYTAVLAVLDELSTRAPMVSLDLIVRHLPQVGYTDPFEETDLRDALDQLKGWQLVEPFRDYTAAVASVNDLLSRQEAWALTKAGRVVVAAVRTASVDVERSLQLPQKLLDGVERTVRSLIERAADDPGLLPSGLDDVRTRIDELQRAVADFYAAIAKLVQADVTDDSVFGENRDRVIDALQQFPREYERALRRVDVALGELDALGVGHVVELAVGHAGLIDRADEQRWVDERVRRVEDLAAWFADEGTIQRLVASSTGAVQTLLVAIDRRYAASRRGSDLGADFHTLARSLHAQPDDGEARRVFAAAFGLWPARHPVANAAEDVAGSTDAAGGAVRHRVEVTLREHERHGPRSGRPRKVGATGDARVEALKRAREQVTERRALTAALVTPGTVGLGHFAGLGSDAARVLFRAVEVALAAYDPAVGFGEGHADEAGVIVRVSRADTDVRVVVELAEGRLEGPDLAVEVRPAAQAGDLDRREGVA
jgi:uncharacterized protein (TIGR02677 family)